MILADLIANIIYLALVKVLAQTSVWLTVFGTEATRAFWSNPAIVGALQCIASGSAGRFVNGTVQLVVTTVPRTITKPIDLQTSAIAADRLGREALLVYAALPRIFVRIVHHVILEYHTTIDVPVARPLGRYTAVGHFAMELALFTRVSLICRTREPELATELRNRSGKNRITMGTYHSRLRPNHRNNQRRYHTAT